MRTLFACGTFFAIVTLCEAAEEQVPDSSLAHLPPMTVSAPARRSSETMTIDSLEHRTGFVDEINDLLFTQAGVERVPEASSSLLINGRGPYDNRYLVAGIPMWAPSHFANHTYHDYSGIAIHSLDQFTLLKGSGAGRFTAAPAGVISFVPGICRPSPPKLVARPELVLSQSTMLQDISVSVPLRKKDLYQFSISRSEKYTALQFRWLNAGEIGTEFSSNSQSGTLFPAGFIDLSLTGKTKAGPVVIRTLAWLANDRYGEILSDPRMHLVIQSTQPWGMVSVIVEDTAHRFLPRLTLGGTKQYAYNGKQLGLYIPRLETNRATAFGSLSWDDRLFGPFTMHLSLEAEQIDWETTSRVHRYAETFFVRDDFHSVIDTFVVTESTVVSTIAALERRGYIVGGARLSGQKASVGADVAAGIIVPGRLLFADPALWAEYQGGFETVTVRVAAVSQQPDERMMPTRKERESLSRTFVATSRIASVRLPFTEFSLSPYCSYSASVAQRSLRPDEPGTDPALATPLLAKGIDLSWSNTVIPHCEILLAHHFGSSQRINGNERAPYEWDIPWSTKAVVHVNAMENRIHAYATGIFAAGLPYRDMQWNGAEQVFAEEFDRVPSYKRIDFAVQYRSRELRHRHLTRYDISIGLRNPFSFNNTREYYWNTGLDRIGVQQQVFSVYYGLRVGLRL